MAEPRGSRLAPGALLVCGICAVGSAALLARLGLQAGLGPLQLSLWRLTIAAAILVAWDAAKYRNSPKISPPDSVRIAIAGVCLAIHFATWIASLEMVSVALSTLLVATTPLWAGLYSLLIPSKRPRRVFWAGLAAAFVGMALVSFSGERFVGTGGSASLGEILAVSGAVAIVPMLLLVQDVQLRLGTRRTVTWLYLAAAVALLGPCLATGQADVPHNAAGWASVIGMALGPQLVGHTLLNHALHRFSASQVAAATLLEPVFASMLAWVLLGERVTPLQAAGGALLLFGVGLALRGGGTAA